MGYYWCSSDWEIAIPTGNSYEKLTAGLGHSCEIAGLPQKRIHNASSKGCISKSMEHLNCSESFLGKSNAIGQNGSKLCYMIYAYIYIYAFKWIVNCLVALDF